MIINLLRATLHVNFVQTTRYFFALSQQEMDSDTAALPVAPCPRRLLSSGFHMEFQINVGAFESQFTEISIAKINPSPSRLWEPRFFFSIFSGPREEGPPDTDGQAQETAEQQNHEASLGESLRGDRGIEVLNFLD